MPSPSASRRGIPAFLGAALCLYGATLALETVAELPKTMSHGVSFVDIGTGRGYWELYRSGRTLGDCGAADPMSTVRAQGGGTPDTPAVTPFVLSVCA